MRIYVANLAAYVSGRLIGQWFDLDDYRDADELREAIQTEVIAPYGGEEWAIHDYEGFGSWKVGEYESLNLIWAVKELAEEKSIEAVTAYIDLVGSHYVDADSIADGFESAHMGEAESGAAWAQDLALESIPDGTDMSGPFAYVDWGRYWHGEFECNGYRFIDGHVFDGNV